MRPDKPGRARTEEALRGVSGGVGRLILVEDPYQVALARLHGQVCGPGSSLGGGPVRGQVRGQVCRQGSWAG